MPKPVPKAPTRPSRRSRSATVARIGGFFIPRLSDEEQCTAWRLATTNTARVVKRLTEAGVSPISVEIHEQFKRLAEGVPVPLARPVRGDVHVMDAPLARLRIFGDGAMPPLVVNDGTRGFLVHTVWVYDLDTRDHKEALCG